MSYVFSHAFIPLSILFIFSQRLNLNQRYIIYLSFFGIFPDFDAIFHHRYTFHNIFILIIPVLIFIFFKNKQIYGMITYYLSSHLILDMFNGGIGAFYPFSTKIAFINAGIIHSNSLHGMAFLLNYGFVDKFAKITESSYNGIISSENSGIIVLLSIMILVFIVYDWKQKRTDYSSLHKRLEK